MAAHRCAQCGAQYPIEFAQNWGRTKGSDGLGPRPRCAALVPAVGVPLAPKRRADGGTEWEVPQQVCGGELIFSATAAPNVDAQVVAAIEPKLGVR